MLKTFYVSFMTFLLVAFVATAGQADHQPFSGIPEPPITVAPADFVDLEEAFAPWDHIADRKVFIEDSRDPHVVWRSSDSNSYAELGSKCVIHLADNYTLGTVQHELGHCLGFDDHITAGHPYGDSEDKVCDDTSHRHYSPYSGVMSYCDFQTQNNWWGNDDIEMLAAAEFEYQDPAPWAEDVWNKAYQAGVVTDDSDPWKTVTKQELMAFFDRAGLLD